MTRPLLSFALMSVFLCSAACSSKSAQPDSGDGAGGEPGASGAGSGGQSSATSVSCPTGTNPKSDPKPTDVGVVSGQIIDEQGAPTSAGLVQVCGTDICINARVGHNGKLAQDVAQTLSSPACKFGDGFTWAKLALPIGKGDTDLGTLMTVRLPDDADAAPFVAGTAVSSGGVTLTLDASAHFDFDVLDYETAAEQGFRAVALPAPALKQLNQDFVAGFALSPLETRICPSPAVSLENTAQLPAGTAVEMDMLGLDADEAWVPYATWQKVSDGQVSDDGKILEFAEGPPILTAIGIREKR